MEQVLIAIPAFLFALGVIVFIHELGHFMVAKLFDMRVLTFSLGFGKRLWGFSFRGTDCRLSAVPLGGYVRLSGEHPDERSRDPADFLNHPRWQRILVYLAGPAMNVVLSVVLITGLFMAGIFAQALQEMPAVVGSLDEGGPGEAAGLRAGDRILQVEGKPVDKWKEVVFALALAPERSVPLSVERDDLRLELEITPAKDPRYEFGDAGIYPRALMRFSEVLQDSPAGKAGLAVGDEVRALDGQPVLDWQGFIDYVEARAGIEIVILVKRGEKLLEKSVVPEEVDGKGRIGIVTGSFRRLPFGEAVSESLEYNWEIVSQSVFLIGKLFSREIAAKSALSGPIEIAAWSGRAARQGFKELLFTMGFLSISIGFMNLLPIPVLDGGHITILLVESVLRRDLSLIVKERITQVGFMLLMTLMAMVIFFDLARNLPSLMPGS